MRIHTCLTCALFLIFGPNASTAFGVDLADLFERPEAPWFTRKTDRAGRGEEEHLETDRDSFTPATTTVEAGRLLFESAYSFIDNRATADSHSFPEIVTRYGLTDRVELRLGWNYEIGGGGTVSNGDAGGELEPGISEQESQMLYGIKFAVTEQNHWLPQSAVIIQGVTPTSGPAATGDFQLGYVFGWKIFDDWHLDSSIRSISTQEEDDHYNLWAPSVVLKVPVAERWNVHGEYFGLFTNGLSNEKNGQYFSPGVHYLISPDFEVGVRVGWGLNEDAANSFTNVGFGIRF